MYYNNGILGWLMTIIHFSFPIIFIFILFKLFSSKNDSGNHFSSIGTEDTALDILKKRYTRGEISKEEFHRMKYEINS